MMTAQPSEEAIRKACEEAGIVPTWADLSQQLPDAVIPRLLTALARRIEAEREAVPVAGRFPKHADDCEAMQRPRADCTCSPIYPPKEPTT